MTHWSESVVDGGPSALLMLVKLVPQMNNGNLQQATAELVGNALRLCQDLGIS